jgi:hypothetical protein
MSDTGRRVTFLIVLALLAAGALALGQGDAGRAPAAHPRPPVDGPEIGAPGNVSDTWYCAEGTSSVDGRATETVIVGNLEPHDIDIETTVMPGPGSGLEEKTQAVRLAAYEQRRIALADIIRAPEPGVVVEVFGGRAVVEHEIEGLDDVAVGPCARRASRHWLFAEGSTDRGSEDWLALFNPHPTDAIVDVTLLTEEGEQSPEAVQALVVPRRSRVSVAMHDLDRRQAEVGVEVRATSGRVVAERTARFDGSDARRGIALTLGATAAAPRWRFPVGDEQDGAAQSLSLANFTDHTTNVDVSVVLDGETAVRPETVAVPGSSVVRVDVSGKVAPGSEYAVEVASTDGTPIVAGAFTAWAPPAPVRGVATTTGSVSAARRWAFAVGRLDGDGNAIISIVNVGDAPVTVQIYAYTNGDANSPASAPAEAVPAGARVAFSLGERGIQPDQVIVVEADGPIVVGREIVGPGGSIAPGVPFRAVRVR